MSTQHTIDDRAVRAKARAMSTEALRWSIADALEASRAAEALEAAGCFVSKTGGFYRDEAVAYAAELKRRERAKARS